jgi:hypothetical protein
MSEFSADCEWGQASSSCVIAPVGRSLTLISRNAL